MTIEISLRKYTRDTDTRYLVTLERAVREGYRIEAHAYEAAPQGLYDLSAQDAAEIAAQDPSLIYLVRES